MDKKDVLKVFVNHGLDIYNCSYLSQQDIENMAQDIIDLSENTLNNETK